MFVIKLLCGRTHAPMTYSALTTSQVLFRRIIFLTIFSLSHRLAPLILAVTVKHLILQKIATRSRDSLSVSESRFNLVQSVAARTGC